MEKTAVIEMRNVSKSFPGIKANDAVNLSLYEGEVHALLGENGAGKSTLMSILTGNYRPDEGELYYRGKQVQLRKPKDAVQLGIGMVHQHFRLVETLSAVENIILASRQSGFLIHAKENKQDILACAEQYGMQIDTNAKVWQLSIGEQQRVEIVKLLYQGTEILILDEPTAVLTPQETRTLFSNLRKMAQMGKTIVFITHKLYEVMEFSDRITVLRAGKSVATMRTADTTKEELTRLMVGREVVQSKNEDSGSTGGECVLQLTDVVALNDKRLKALNGINLSVHAGEITCIAGIAGNGQKELGEVIAGLRKIQSGHLSICGEEVQSCNAKEMIKKGVAFIPEDRLGMGLVPNLNMYRNFILKNYDSPESSRHGVLLDNEISCRTKASIDSFQIYSAGAEKPVKLMSGGNQQKLLLAREVEKAPRLIIATYPVRGLDISAAEAIHQVFLQEKKDGTAILLISEDLDEIFALADTIAVLHEGRIVGQLSRNVATYESVGRLMLGEADTGNLPVQEGT